jgi:putative PIN family toxin of toxin-antitoxin system
VIVSGLVGRSAASPPVLIIEAWRAGRFTLIVSDHILAEVTRTLDQPYFQARLSAEDRAGNILLLRNEAEITPIVNAIRGMATHPEDDLILTTALRSKSDYLVTGDTQLQRISRIGTTLIVTPRQFSEMLTGTSL